MGDPKYPKSKRENEKVITYSLFVCPTKCDLIYVGNKILFDG
jgi:hypothetical protein